MSITHVSMQLIAILIVVAGLAYYALKRTGYIEGMKTAVGESDPNIIKETGTKKRTVIA